MDFSIIIPTLNEEKLLPKLLKQLSSSDLKNKFDYEIIISDGGSKDNTILIAEKYANKVFVHKENFKQNIAMGRNKGREFAKSEILVFLSGDSIIADPEKLFLRIIDKVKNDKYIAFTCAVKVFPAETKFIDRVFQTFYNNYFHSLNLIGVGMGRGECNVVKSEIFDLLNGYNEKIVAGEDFDFFKRIRRKGKIYFARDIFIYESPRRYREFGHFRLLLTWLINSIFVVLAKKSLSKVWREVR
ncbi:MAG: glycosyltransferase [bacterium]